MIDTGEKKCLFIFNLFTYYIFKKRKRPFISLGRPRHQCYVKYHEKSAKKVWLRVGWVWKMDERVWKRSGIFLGGCPGNPE